MPFLNVNHAEIYYELHGQGQPLVLISGYTCDHDYWIPVLSELCQHFQVLILDNRGVGKTIDSNSEITIEQMADDVMALCRELKLEKPHIVGHSMGGTIAQSIGIRYSHEIGKLVVLCSSSKWRQATIRLLKAVFKLREEGGDPQVILDVTLSFVFGEKFLQKKENLQIYRNLFFEKTQSIQDQRRQLLALEQFDSRLSLDKIKATTLIGYAEEDVLSLPSESKYLADGISHAKLISFKTGHAAIGESPFEVLEALMNFFAY